MIASTKLARAQKAMDAGRIYGSATQSLYFFLLQLAIFNHLKVSSLPLNVNSNQLLVAVSSDRGLCGAIHSSISKLVKRTVQEVTSGSSEIIPSILVLGDKAKPQIAREARRFIYANFNQLGKAIPVFLDASNIVDTLNKDLSLTSSFVRIFYNHFKSVIAYENREINTVTSELVQNLGK